MKKKFFDKNLMLDGLSQLKLSGIILFILSFAATVLPAIFKWLNLIQLQKENTTASIASNLTISSVELSGLLIPVMYIAPFVFCLILFAFLNNRKGSDFFHSLPQSRICMFLSYTVSIIIWIAAIIVITILAASLIYAVAGVTFSAVFIPYVIFTLFAGSMLVLACMLFAMSITGTVFSNIMVFGLILFLPRLLISVYTMAVSYALPILNVQKIGQLFNINYDIPSKFIAALFHITSLGTANGNDLFISVLAIIFTLVLALIYLGVACLLFHFRKSETAGSSAPNNILQHVYRCAITIPLTLFIPCQYISFIANNPTHMSFWDANCSGIIAIIVISLIIYYLFEILTTKKVKNLLKATPFLLIIILFDFVFGFSLTITRNNALNFKPTTDQIQSVSVIPCYYNYNGSSNNSNYQQTTYNDLLIQNIRFSDSDILGDTTKILDKNVDKLKSGSTDFYNGMGGQYQTYEITFHLKNGKNVERYIYPSNNMASTLTGDMQENTEYINSSATLPPESTITSIGENYYGNRMLTKNQVKQLWNSYKAEYSLLSLDKKLILSTTVNQMEYGGISYNSSPFDVIEVQGNYGTKDYNNYYCITMDTPKTAALYFNMLNQKEKPFVLKAISADLKADSSSNYYYFTVYNDPDLADNQEISMNMSQSNTTCIANNKKVLNLLLSQSDEPVDITKPFVRVNIEGNNYYQNISKQDIAEIKTLASN